MITFTDGKTIAYTYDAAGNKLKMIVTNGTSTTTDYVGGFVYQNTALSFFSSPEGRVVKNGSTYEYQYAIADHQGNTRILFSSVTPVAQPVSTNAETAGSFGNYTNISSLEVFDHTDAGTVNQKSQKLTGAPSSMVGLSKSYKVYPGDKVKAEVYAKYWNVTGSSSDLPNFATMLTSAFAVSASSTGEALKAFNALNSYGGLVAAGTAHDNNIGEPKAFVTILLFDKNYKLLDAAWDQIDDTYAQGTDIAIKNTFDLLSKEVTIKEEGFAYVYLSNESPTGVDVYFDDITLTYTPGNIVQYNEYYPFGLQTANSWTRENTTGNNFLGNGGTELNTTSGVYDLEFRNYDPALARMNQVDPMAHKYSSTTPYNYSFNNPVTLNDPNGAEPVYQDYYYQQESAAQARATANLGYAIQSNNIFARVNRPFGSSMTFGYLSYSDVGRAYEAQMKEDANNMSIDEYAEKYGEKVELWESWEDTYTNGRKTDERFLGYKLKTQGDPFGGGETQISANYTIRGYFVGPKLLTLEFGWGFGPERSLFGGDHPLTKGLKNSVIVERAKEYYAEHYPNGGEMWRRHIDFYKSDIPFANDIENFVGSARVSILPTEGGIYFVVDNTTSIHSGTYDYGKNIPRSSDGWTQGGNTYQRYIWFEKK